MIDRKYAELNLIEKAVKEKEKELKNEDYEKKVFSFMENLKSVDKIPENLNNGEIVRFKNSLILKDNDNYFLLNKRTNYKVLNPNEILEKHKEDVAEYIQKKPLTKTEIDKMVKEEFKKFGIKFDRKLSFEDALDVLLAKNSTLAKDIVKEFDIEKTKQIRTKRNVLDIDDIEDFRNYLIKISDIVSMNELNFVKLGLLKEILNEISLKKEEIREEILKNEDKFKKSNFISINNLVKLSNKIFPEDMKLAKENLSNSLAKNEELAKKVNAEVEKKDFLVIYKPLKSIKEIEELLNVQKEFVAKKNNINNSRFGIV